MNSNNSINDGQTDCKIEDRCDTVQFEEWKEREAGMDDYMNVLILTTKQSIEQLREINKLADKLKEVVYV